ncbi:hypothetical protein JOC78_002297 [Bacillus ectoiniformans]|uniref:hypothetical protein n=1 Tax=Bacillus ectoiniformans TaxID=1494429 RepID=UPI00195CC8D6|nr:hypothetical protein [Bacillus ectoiniformans]MBM7649344.1 hypothetical protein [Bacillus ectoiniformans]
MYPETNQYYVNYPVVETEEELLRRPYGGGWRPRPRPYGGGWFGPRPYGGFYRPRPYGFGSPFFGGFLGGLTGSLLYPYGGYYGYPMSPYYYY